MASLGVIPSCLASPFRRASSAGPRRKTFARARVPSSRGRLDMEHLRGMKRPRLHELPVLVDRADVWFLVEDRDRDDSVMEGERELELAVEDLLFPQDPPLNCLASQRQTSEPRNPTTTSTMNGQIVPTPNHSSVLMGGNPRSRSISAIPAAVSAPSTT